MSLKDFLDEKTSLVDRIDRTLYSGSLIDAALQERQKSGKSIDAVRIRVQQFFAGVPRFSEWVKMSDKESFDDEVRNLYKETNK